MTTITLRTVCISCVIAAFQGCTTNDDSINHPYAPGSVLRLDMYDYPFGTLQGPSDSDNINWLEIGDLPSSQLIVWRKGVPVKLGALLAESLGDKIDSKPSPEEQRKLESQISRLVLYGCLLKYDENLTRLSQIDFVEHPGKTFTFSIGETGKKLTLPCTVAEMKAALGEPVRLRKYP